MNSLVVFISLALVAFVASQDVIVSGSPFLASDSSTSPSFASVKNAAGVTLQSVTFTVVPVDPTIAIYYPNSASKSTVGSIANGASGTGNFQILSPSGVHQVNVIVNYKKGSSWFNVSSTHDLVVEGYGTEGKRSDDSAPIVVRGSNSDLTVTPLDGWYAQDATPTWQYITVSAASSTLTSVSYTITPSDPSVIGIYYDPKTGNTVGTVTSSQPKTNYFQMNGPHGTFTFTVTVNYKKGTTSYTYTENLRMYITNGAGSEGKRLAQVAHNFLPSTVASNPTAVLGLAVGGVALIAIVAVVVVVAVVKRRTTPIIA